MQATILVFPSESGGLHGAPGRGPLKESHPAVVGRRRMKLKVATTKVLEIPEGTVWSRLSYARKGLRKRLMRSQEGLGLPSER